MPQFDAHTANSEYTAAELTPANPRHPRPVFVRHMGVDAVTFTRDRTNADRRRLRRASLGVPEGKPLLFFAGRLSAEKHVLLLVDMMRELTGQSAWLVIAGDGPLRNEIRRRAQTECPGRLHLLDTIVDREALAEWLADADLFVHPNPREPFGIGPLEAMAAERPVVVSDRGGVRSYANNENAWLAKPTGADVARAVSQALTHGSERERRCRRGLETAAQLTWPTAAAKFFALYYEIASWHSRVYADRHPQRWLRADIAAHEEVS